MAKVAQLGDRQPPEGLPLAQPTQPGDRLSYGGLRFAGWRHQPGHGAAMAGDRDLRARARRIQQGRQMGLLQAEACR